MTPPYFDYNWTIRPDVEDKFGKGFISISEKMITNQKKGKIIINLKNNDELLNVHHYVNDYLALVSKNEKLLILILLHYQL